MQKVVKKLGGGQRNSNLELFRIITMVMIVAHHYVVNSGLSGLVHEAGKIDFNSIFLILFGWGGKTGINCFVLITGYFMCKSNITVKKYIKLLGERYFYCVVFFAIFLLTGYIQFSVKDALNIAFPFFTVQSNFMSCFLLFYLFIPFLNKLIHAMNEKEHIMLVGLCLFIYTVLPTFAFAQVSFNYVTWFIVLYFVASYLRIYEKNCFCNTRLWGMLTVLTLILSWASVVSLYILGNKIGHSGIEYYFVADSNKILALVTAVCAFMFFKNVHIPQSKIINRIAASTLGVLLIHANSDTMRQWLWQDVLKNTIFFVSPMLIVHALVSVCVVYIVCTVIDQVRIWVVEKPFFKVLEKWGI